jgi:thiamine pyrophosphate-dependent acetolactate synthase large subunit-like protein
MSKERQAAKMLNRSELTRRLVTRLTHDEAVVAGLGNTNFDLIAAGHRPQNFYMLGSMGLACPIGLGVALAQPQRGVIALEGDGSILMALGCLTTIGNVRPRNLTIIIWDNGIYQITGKQAAATSGVTDIVAVARAAGIPSCEWVRDAAHFDQLIDRRFTDGGPMLMAAKIDDQPGKGPPLRDPVLIRESFMRGLGTSSGNAVEL